MASAESQLEAAVFQTILPQLQAEGFEVFLHPSRQMLPSFLQPYRPDAIALKADKKLAIEVTTAGGQTETKLQRLRQLFAGREDWELRVIYAPPLVVEKSIPVPSRELIQDHLDRVSVAYDAVGPTAALLTAWSVFEAVARSLIPIGLTRPQQPVRLIEVLASEGYVTPDEADTLRRLGQVRNEAAHGRLDVAVSQEDLARLVDVIRTLLKLQGEAALSAQ